MTDHQTLLAEYTRNGSDAAFRKLVTRYVDLVFSTALRLVEGDTHRAEDVVQTVFVDLARVARTLPADVKLGGWLHRDTCFVAATLMRGERRRQARERQAVEMNVLQNHSEADYSLVAPLLDEAINELGEADRTAILLRFFEQQDFRAVGQALGSNEDAARMRVTRALEKLEQLLKRRGVTTTAASLGVVLTANAIQAAPVGLAVTTSTAAALAATSIATTATSTAVKTSAMSTLQKTLITATLAAAVGTGIYEVRQVSNLRDHTKALQQQQAEEIQQLRRERDEATSNFAALRDENQRINRNAGEVLKLRGEVARLRQTSANGKLKEPMQAPAGSLLRLPVISRDSIAQARRDLSWDQAIVTGGWKSQSDSSNRVFVFASPRRGDNASQVTIETQIVECPESVAEALGLSQISTPLTTEGKSSDILTAGQYAAMMKSARDAAGVKFLGSPSITALSGQQAQVRAMDMKKTLSGEEFDVGPVVNLVSTISADGQSIDLRIFAHPNNLLPAVDINH